MVALGFGPVLCFRSRRYGFVFLVLGVWQARLRLGEGERDAGGIDEIVVDVSCTLRNDTRASLTFLHSGTANRQPLNHNS